MIRLALALTLALALSPAATMAQTGERVTLSRVIDGDTIDVIGSRGIERVRIASIDTPERGCRGFREARARLQRLAVPPITLERGERRTGRQKDRNGRTLGYVWSGRTDIAETMIREGHAVRWPNRAGC